MNATFDNKTGLLTLTVKLDPTGRPSSTGKSTLHYTITGHKIDGTSYKANVTVYGPKRE